MADVIDAKALFAEKQFNYAAASEYFEIPEDHPGLHKLAVILMGHLMLEELEGEEESELTTLRARVAELERDRVELGCGGHFVAAGSCRFRRHTQTRNFRISTVGDYFPDGRDRQEIGYRRNFETMVFRTAEALVSNNEGCGCQEVSSWSEVESDGYLTAGEAQLGHERLVSKYAAAMSTEEGEGS